MYFSTLNAQRNITHYWGNNLFPSFLLIYPWAQTFSSCRALWWQDGKSHYDSLKIKGSHFKVPLLHLQKWHLGGFWHLYIEKFDFVEDWEEGRSVTHEWKKSKHDDFQISPSKLLNVTVVQRCCLMKGCVKQKK